MIGVQCQLVICRGHIRASNGTFQIFPWLMVLWQEWKTCTFLGSKHKNAISDGTPLHVHMKPSLYVCRRAQGSQIFKQNSIISIHSCFIEFLRFELLRLQEGGAGGWRSIWGHRRVPIHKHIHMCTYAYMHMHLTLKNYMLSNYKWPLPWRQPCLSWLTCMGMCVKMHVCMCMHMYTRVGLTPLTLTSTHLPPTAKGGGDPWKQYKFNKSWTNRDKSILFADLESV